MRDEHTKAKEALDAAINAAVQKTFAEATDGNEANFIGNFKEALGADCVVPAAATERTDAGVKLIITPERLFRKTAGELRNEGLLVANSIPDFAEVVKDETGRLVFHWSPFEVTDETNPTN